MVEEGGELQGRLLGLLLLGGQPLRGAVHDQEEGQHTEDRGNRHEGKAAFLPVDERGHEAAKRELTPHCAHASCVEQMA